MNRTKRPPPQMQGVRVGRWVVGVFAFSNANRRYWNCKCDCGSERQIEQSSLRRGITKSCGCLSRERARKAFTKHGWFGTPEYNTWGKIVQRCCNPKDKSFPRYGGRGILICDEWRKSFEAFLRDMGEKPSPHHSIDRINNSLGYSKENCRWATSREQQQNRTNNTMNLATARKIKELRLSGMTPGPIANILGIKLHSVNNVFYHNAWSNA